MSAEGPDLIGFEKFERPSPSGYCCGRGRPRSEASSQSPRFQQFFGHPISQFLQSLRAMAEPIFDFFRQFSEGLRVALWSEQAVIPEAPLPFFGKLDSSF